MVTFVALIEFGGSRELFIKKFERLPIMFGLVIASSELLKRKFGDAFELKFVVDPLLNDPSNRMFCRRFGDEVEVKFEAPLSKIFNELFLEFKMCSSFVIFLMFSIQCDM